MAENKMTIHEAVDLITNSKLEFSDEQLAQMNEVFYKDFLERHSDDVKIARDFALELAEQRIVALHEQQGDYDAADLDNIIALANSISGFTRKADMAKEVLDKAQKQKETSEANKSDEIAIGIKEGAEEKSTEEQKSTAEQDPLKEAENIPEDEAELAKFDKKYGIDKTSKEQLEVNRAAMGELEGLDPFALNDDGKLVQTELQKEYDTIQGMEITDDEGKPLPEEEQKKAKGTLLDTIVYDARMLTRGTAKGNAASIKDQYISNLKAAMQRAVVSTAFASEIKGKPQTKEAYGEAFVKATSQEGGLKTSLKNVVAYAGIVNGEMTKLTDRLKAKFGEIPAVKEMNAKIAAFDENMDKKHPKTWKMAKRIGKIVQKRAKGVAMYSIVGAVAGPYGLAALAVKSGYDIYNNFKAAADKEGVSFRDYAKAHKFDIGLAAVTTLVATGGTVIGLVGGGSELAQTVSPYLKTATRALAVAPKAIKAGYHKIKAAVIKKGWIKGDAEKEMAAAKAAFDQTIDASIGMVAGAVINEVVNYYSDRDNDGIIDGKDIDHGQGWATANEKQLESLMNDAEQVNTILGEGHHHTPEELRNMLANGEFTDEQLKVIHELATKGFDENGKFYDEDDDKIPDYRDIDHGKGWAKANEEQLEDLMKYPKEVNAILGEGHNHTSEELSKMLDEGKFTDEQLEKIHGLAIKDEDNDKIPDYKDVDHGKGWATANEKQLDRLMEANPDGVKAILGGDKEYKSDELKDMLKEGKFTEKQLEDIHTLASSQFDKEGHITDPELKKYYEDLARQARANANASANADANAGASDKEADGEKLPTQPEVKEDEASQGRSEAEQKMYDSILETVSKGENMADPTIKTSVEGLAEGYLNDVTSALASGKEQEAIDILQGIHKQGEDVEVREATQREADDSRGVRHAKEDLSKVYTKLDDAKAALAADPDNEKLQQEVDKLEKEFDKKSLNLDNKEIKQEKSELNTRIDRDNTSAKNLDWTRGELEKMYGVSQEAADKQLIAAGFDLKNLPENTENLPENVQKLINAHNQYAQVDRTEAALHGRVEQNEERRDDLKSQEKENKEALKEVKKGHGFSQDDEKRIKIEDRLPGQSDFRDSRMASSLVNMVKGGTEEVNEQTSEQVKESNNAKAVDKFLNDQVASGNMTEAEAQAKREELIAMADQKEAAEKAAAEKAAAEKAAAEKEAAEKAAAEKAAAEKEAAEKAAAEKAAAEKAAAEKAAAEKVAAEKAAAEKAAAEKAAAEKEAAEKAAAEKEGTEKEGTEKAESASKAGQGDYRTNDLSTLKNDYLEDIEKNHGLNDVKNIYVSGESHSTNGQGSMNLVMINSGSNGYAMIAQEGAESFIIDNENKTLNFRVGSGDNLRDMTYSEAKEFTESIMNINDPESDKGSVLKYQMMLVKLYEIDKEAYAQDMQQEGTLSSTAKILGCDVDKMRELHHETNTAEKVSEEKHVPENSEINKEQETEEQTKSEELADEKQGQESKAEEKTENREVPEAVAEPYVAETPAGSISYEMTEDGHLNSSGTLFAYKDQKNFDAIKEEIVKNMGSQGNPSSREAIATANAQIAYMADAINKDIDARQARGEDVPHAEEMKALNNAQLKKMGLEYSEDGKLQAAQSNTGNMNMPSRGKGGR